LHRVPYDNVSRHVFIVARTECRIMAAAHAKSYNIEHIALPCCVARGGGASSSKLYMRVWRARRAQLKIMCVLEE